MKEKKQKFINVDVEKLNIVDKEGNVKLSLFNSDNIPPAIMDGEDILPGHRQDDNTSGIMFYNGEGDECGGLIFGSKKKENGEYESGLSLTFDQYKQDQVVQMLVSENNGQRNYGFNIYDRPNKPITDLIEESQKVQKMEDGPEKQKALKELFDGNHQRIFMGKSQNGDVSVRLSDSKGKERIRMVIDIDDVPRMEFLNGLGEVIYRLPPKEN
jgi:hypothetical protein